MRKILLLAVLLFVLTGVNAMEAFATSTQNDTTVYENLQLLPKYPGGIKAYSKFFQKNLKWPDPQIDVQGHVLISFIVEKNGSLTHFKIEKGLQEKFDAEASRVIKLSPHWIPARLNAKHVRSKYTVPINFTLSE